MILFSLWGPNFRKLYCNARYWWKYSTVKHVPRWAKFNAHCRLGIHFLPSITIVLAPPVTIELSSLMICFRGQGWKIYFDQMRIVCHACLSPEENDGTYRVSEKSPRLIQKERFVSIYDFVSLCRSAGLRTRSSTGPKTDISTMQIIMANGLSISASVSHFLCTPDV